MARTLTIRFGRKPINPLWNWVSLMFALSLFAWNSIVLMTQAPNGLHNNPANTALSAVFVVGAVGSFIEQRRWKQVQLVVSFALLAVTFWLTWR